MRQFYPLNKGAAFSGGANCDLIAGAVKIVLLTSGYAFSAAHQFLSDIVAGNRVAISPALTGKSMTVNIFNASAVTLPSVSGSQVVAYALFIDTGTEATSRLIFFEDARAQVEVAVTATGGATAVTTEDLPVPIASGATLTKISGTGDATLTTTALAAAGARSIAVSAVTTGPVAGAVYEYPASGVGLPVTPNGGNITITFDAGTYKIFRV